MFIDPLVFLPLFDNVLSATTLSGWHLAITFLSLHFARSIGLFEHKAFDTNVVIGFGFLNGASIGLLNLSLGFNSVGFYQVSALLRQPLNLAQVSTAKVGLMPYSYSSCFAVIRVSSQTRGPAEEEMKKKRVACCI